MKLEKNLQTCNKVFEANLTNSILLYVYSSAADKNFIGELSFPLQYDLEFIVPHIIVKTTSD
jgi:hypothetical protein